MTEQRQPLMMKLPSEESPVDLQYSMPDPDALCDAYARLNHATFSGQEMDRADVRQVLMLAHGYLVLTQSEAGQCGNINRLRDIWRVRRDRRPAR
jgi:Fe-S cluster assembly ATPase SufC